MTPTTVSRTPTGPVADSVVDNKVGVMDGIRRVAEKRKIMQAMSGPALEGSSGLIRRRVVQRRSLMCLLSSMPSSLRMCY